MRTARAKDPFVTFAMLDFLGIGAQRAATTWLYRMLQLHPQVAFPAGKEVHFWNRRIDRGADWYRAQFEPSCAGRRQGEITPGYALLTPPTLRQVHAFNPKLRILFILRNPMERAWSQSMATATREGKRPAHVEDAWFAQQFELPASLNRGDYARSLRHWLAVFPKEQILLLRHEQIATDPRACLTRVARHLDIDPAAFETLRSERMRHRVQPGASTLQPGALSGPAIRLSLRARLRTLYAERIEALRPLVDWDPRDWLQGTPLQASLAASATDAATPLAPGTDRPVMILGMHRSGTSALTGSLQQAGLELGAVDTANPGNEKGHREHPAVYLLNEDLLQRNGGSWHCPPTGVLRWEPIHEVARDQFIGNHARCLQWGFKDPRLLITLDGWLQALPGARLVGVLRHPAQVIPSLAARNGMDAASAAELWLAYNQNLLRVARARGVPLVEFGGEPGRFVAGVRALASRLGLDPEVAANSFYEPSLEHWREPTGRAPQACLSLYDALRAHCIA